VLLEAVVLASKALAPKAVRAMPVEAAVNAP
jgi:hypothetical protein